MPIYTHLVRPLLFRLNPERAHKLSETALKSRAIWKLAGSGISDPRLATTLAGLALKNPIGLAAGYDKDCVALGGLSSLGFGYMVGGTVFPVPREGNPRPRLVRLPAQGALLNAMGFPSKGAAIAIDALAQARTGNTPVIVSIAALDADTFVDLHRRTEPMSRGVELNISSPNTQGIVVFQEAEALRSLLGRINAQRRRPLFIKLPHGFDDASRERILGIVDICVELGVDGVTAGNTRPTPDERLKMGRGGLSGRPLLDATLETLRLVRSRAGAKLAVNGCGGITTGDDALRALKAGADTVQLYTSFIYRGPGVVKLVCGELLKAMAKEGIFAVSSAKEVRQS